MKKILAVVLCCTLAFGLYNCGGGPSDKYVKTAELLNKGLPMTISKEYRLDKVEAASKSEFKYYYTLLVEPEVSVDDFLKANRETIVNTLKGQSEMKDFKDDNMTIIYVYNKQDGSKFAELKVTADEYK